MLSCMYVDIFKEVNCYEFMIEGYLSASCAYKHDFLLESHKSMAFENHAERNI